MLDKSSENPYISIIIPIYNGGKFLKKNLDSISKLVNKRFIELVLVDNNSTDGSLEIVKKFNEKLEINVILIKKNLGFAKPCNIGALGAKGKFLFITNQDVVFPKNFFKILVELYNEIKNDDKIIICPAVIFPDNSINYFGGKIHYSCISYTPQMYKKLPKTNYTFPTIKVSGCSLFIKRKNFIDLGGFDPIFFMYKEDIDFGLRAIKNGFKIYTTNHTKIIHLKKKMEIDDFTYYYLERNRYFCLFKNLNIGNYTNIPKLFLIELMLLFQSIIEKKTKIRIKIFKFLIKNRYLCSKLKFKNEKLDLNIFSRKLDPIVLGNYTFNKILNYFLNIINLIL